MWKNKRGESLAVYGLLVGLVSVAAISAVVRVGEETGQSWTSSTDALRETSFEATWGVPYRGVQVAMTEVVSTDCYDPGNVGAVGTADMPLCAGMLIVDGDMLFAAAAPKNGGNETYQYLTESGPYTFTDDGRNIFIGQVTSTRSLFENSDFNGDIDYWDMSNVRNTSLMFKESSFNRDISGWDVSSVELSMQMFMLNLAFNQDLGDWDLSNCRNTSSMFRGASAFNQDVGAWDVADVTTMNSMFQEAASFNQDLSGWDVSAVTSYTDFDRNSSLVPAHLPAFP